MTSSSIRRIVVAVKDPTATTPPAVVKAAQLALALRAELVLFHGIDVPLYAEAYEARDRDIGDDETSIRTLFLRNLTAQGAPLRQEGLSISVAAEWDHPAFEAVLRYAHRIQADLIVAERHPHSSVTPWALHTTDWELLRLSSKPVLLVKDPQSYQQPIVLAALDPLHRHAKPAELDRDICALAEVLSGGLGGAWHALHAYGGATSQVSIHAALCGGERRASALAALDPLLNSVALKPQSVQLRDLSPTEAILEATGDLHAAIVVMGAMSRSGLKGLLIGNTAERIIDELHCDVLIVKPKSFGIRFSRRVRGPNLLSVTPPRPPC